MVLISTQTARFRDRQTQKSIRVPFFFAFEVQNPNNKSLKYLETYSIGYVPANVNCYKDKMRQIDD